jgi:uncharacterized SAM-binding protein YcdF (DUF218 family)
MLNWLFRFVGSLLSPIAFVWLGLLGLGGWMLWKKRRRSAFVFFGLALGMSLVGSRISLKLVGTLERPYIRASTAEIPEGDAVVMLGGAVEYSKNELTHLNFNSTTDRVVTAVEMMRLGKAKVLVLGGGGDPDGGELSEAQALNNLLESWRVFTAPTHNLGVCKNTHDEALKVQALAREKGWKRILLVTAASHMRRAEAVFRAAGFDVVPVACDFQNLGTVYKPDYNPAPWVDGFRLMDIYLHEMIGWWVYRWRGWV